MCKVFPVLFVLASGCGWGASPSNEDLSNLSDDEVAQRVIVFMNDMIEAGKPHLKDCDKLATAMQGVVDDNQALLVIAQTYKDDPVKSTWFNEHYGEQARGVGMWIFNEVKPACGTHEATLAVLDAL